MRTRSLLSLVAGLSIVGCSEAPITEPVSQPPAVAPAAPPTAQVIRLAGTVQLTDSTDDSGSQAMLLVDGSSLQLSGAVALLQNANGTDIIATGQYVDGRFEITDFEVTGNNGNQAWDGILVYDGEVGYALALRDGTLHSLAAAPFEVTEMLGARIWVAQAEGGDLTAFGYISGM